MESEFTINRAARFSEIAEAAAEIIRRGIEAFERFARALADLLNFTRIRRAIDWFLVRCWAECRALPVALPHTRHAMRARKMRQYRQTFM